MKRNNYTQYEKGQEISGVTFQQHQDQVIESLNSIMLSLGLDTAQATILWGLENSGSGSSYNISQGAIFHNGEIFEVDAFSGTAGDLADVAFVRPIDVPVGDAIRFGDGTISAVHIDHKYEVVLGTPGAGEFGLSTAPRMADALNAIVGANAYTDQQIADLVDGETELDTLAKMSVAIQGLQGGGATSHMPGAMLDQSSSGVLQAINTTPKYIVFNNAEARIQPANLVIPPLGKRVIKLFCHFWFLKNSNDHYFFAGLYYRVGAGAWQLVREKKLRAFGQNEHASIYGHLEFTQTPTDYLEFALKIQAEESGASIRIATDNNIEFEAIY